MVKKISRWLLKISNNWVMVVTLLIMVLFMIFVLPGQAAVAEENSNGSISPDTSFFYGPDDLLQAAKEYGADGRQAYIQARWTFDLVFPLVYISFLVAGISWFYKKLGEPGKLLGYSNLLPLLAGIFDYLENTGASLVMASYPRQFLGLALTTAFFSGVKWLLVGGSFLLYFALAGAVLFQWIRGRSVT